MNSNAAVDFFLGNPQDKHEANIDSNGKKNVRGRFLRSKN